MTSSNDHASTSAAVENLKSTQGEQLRGKLLVAAAGLLFGTVGVFVEEAKQDPFTTVWFRCAFGAVALLLWSWFRGTLPQLRLEGRAWRVVLITGGLVVVMWSLFFASITHTSIAVATVVFHIQPLLVMTFGAWWLKEKVTALQWGMSLLALLGLVLATGLFGSAPAKDAGSSSYLLGLLLCIGGATAYAIVTLIAKANRSVTPFALVTWQCIVGTTLLAWWPWVHGWSVQAGSLGWLAGLGVIHTGLAYVLVYTGMAKLSAGKIAALQFVYPATAVLVDWLVYGRTLSAIQLIGVAMMAVAIGVVSRAR
ncbi:MAG: EamA family transporter [Burkholderiales bacterium]|nr:MAG: EamA family transporter [Burkholderiales bacterium]